MVMQTLLPALFAALAMLCPNGDFARGIDGWHAEPTNNVTVRKIDPADHPFAHALEIDARNGDATLVHSDPFPITPLQHYRFSAWTKRLEGEQGWSLHVSWRDAAGAEVAYNYAWVTPLAGRTWERYAYDAIAPAAATHARVEIVVRKGWGVQVADIRLEPAQPVGPRLSIDLMPEPIAPRIDAEAPLQLRLESRGDVVLENICVNLRLPKGLTFVESGGSTAQEKDFEIEALSFGVDWLRDMTMRGKPARSNAPIVCTVRAKANGKPVRFRAQTPPFITVAEERPTPTAQLTAPAPPKSSVRLGCYYFPVMLDWDRAGFGVRAANMKPRLGYYDEALPEVGDWHIHWALEHGISWFVFDWYFNQDMDYLNDALEKGFLKSRFANRMQFCVDWCNEGHCGQFKPVDFSDASLDAFITALCDRYFPYPNYLRVDGKPVVFIHVPLKIVNAHGGWDGCRAALDRMRKKAQQYGHPGIYFVAVQSNLPYPADFQRGGFDALSAYAYGFSDVPWDSKTRSLPYLALPTRHRESFAIAQREAHARGLDYIPSAWVGWDDRARSKDQAVRTEGNTPGAFRRMIESLPQYVEKDLRLALVESWNEWGEGGQMEPGDPDGFGRVAAARDILTAARGPYVIAVPTDKDVAQFHANITHDEVETEYFTRYARKLGLDKEVALEYDDPIGLAPRIIQDIGATSMRNGVLTISVTAQNPILAGPPYMMLDSQNVAAFMVRLRAKNGDAARLLWKRADFHGNWEAAPSISAPLPTDGAFHEIRFDVGRSPEWRGVIFEFALAPSNAPGEVVIDWIRTEPPTTRSE